MKKVCIYREGATERYRGKRVKWIVCKACRHEMIEFYKRNLKVFIRSEIKSLISEMSKSSMKLKPGWLLRKAPGS